MSKVNWLTEIIEALKELGGHAYYSDLYEKVKERGNIDFSVLKDPNAQIRGTIERFSKDSSGYGDKEDIFYAVEGIGKGHWGLKDFKPEETNVDLTKDDSEFPEGKEKLR